MSNSSEETQLVPANAPSHAPHWHAQEAKILKAWAETSASQKWMHQRAYQRMSRYHIMFALPVIVISTIAGTANFATGAVPPDYREYVSLVTGALNLICSIITTVSQFLKLSERREGHRAASCDYGKLSRKLATELQLPIADRSSDGRVLLDNARKEIERLSSASPDLPLSIVKLFGKRFRKSTFRKPEILKLFPVEVFEDDYNAHDKLKAEREAAHKVALEAAAADAKAVAAAEFKRSVQETVNSMRKQEHKRRKKSVSASQVASSMTRFMSSLDPSGASVSRPPPTDFSSAPLHERIETLLAVKEPSSLFKPDVVIPVHDDDHAAVGDEDEDSTPTPCSLSDSVGVDITKFGDGGDAAHDAAQETDYDDTA